MSFFAYADQILIDRFFQPIVDRLQRTPRYLARQCSILFFICFVLRVGFFSDFSQTNGIWLYTGVTLLLAAGAYFLSSSDLLLAHIGQAILFRWWLAFWFFFSVMTSITLLLVNALEPNIVCKLAMDGFIFAFSFFAACKPPKPPKKKEQKVLRESFGSV